MIRLGATFLLSLVLVACASVRDARLAHFCGTDEGAGVWTELDAPPQRAEIYLAVAKGARNETYWNQHSIYWFTGVDGATRLCAVNRRMPGCSGGWWDFPVGSDTPVDDESEWICVS